MRKRKLAHSLIIVCFLSADCASAAPPSQSSASPQTEEKKISLDLADSDTSDADLIYLKQLSHLRRLILKNTAVTDAGLVHLQNLSLTWLNLANTSITDSGLEKIKGLHQLKALVINGTKITDSGLIHLKHLTKLSSLWIGNTRVTDQGLAHLSSLPLRILELDRLKVSDAGLIHIKKLPLKVLNLSDTNISDDSLSLIGEHSTLVQLFLRRTRISDAGLTKLWGLSQLEKLVVNHTQISDLGLSHLKKLKNLRKLYIHGTPVTSYGIKNLTDSNPGLTVYGDPRMLNESELEDWMNYYYLNPRPELTVPAIFRMSQRGLLTKGTARSRALGMLSGVFKQNPQSIQQWFELLNDLSVEERNTLWTALWYAGNNLARVSLKNLADKHNLLPGQETKPLLEKKPPELLHLDISSLTELDILWGRYTATGDEEYILRIMTALPWAVGSTRGNTQAQERYVIGTAARWLLIEQAAQHDRVLEICRGQLSHQKGGTRQILQTIIAKAEEK